MGDRIDAVLDHVAIAVEDWGIAERRWREDLGGGRSSAGGSPVLDWAAFTGFTREPPRADAPELLGPLLQHPDLDEAERIWALLGATVARADATLRCTWTDSPLDDR